MNLTLSERHSALVAGIFGLMLSIALWFVIIPWQVPLRETGFLSPRFFPRIVAATLFLLSAALLVVEYPRGKSVPSEGGGTTFHLRPLLLLGLILIYLFAMDAVGYLLSTICATPLFLLFFGARKWTTILAITAILPWCLYELFTRFLNAYLPTGWLFS